MSTVFPILGKTFEKGELFELNLDYQNPELADLETKDTEAFDRFIFSKGTVGYGGYGERRKIYEKSTDYTIGDTRCIHLGIDIWAAANTKIYAPIDGIIYCFRYNEGYGNYGPTIITYHETEGFFLLFGHLSLASLEGLKRGAPIKSGTCIGELGSSAINGDWPPHLHFQKIIDMQGLEGDYPGVCTLEEKEGYMKNCPDPTALVKLY